MAFESQKQFESDPGKDLRREPIGGARESDPGRNDRRRAIGEVLGKLDVNTMADSFDRFKVEFKALLDQNPGTTFEDAMDVFGQIVSEERKKPRSEAVQSEKQNEKLISPSPRLVGAIRRALSREEQIKEIEALFDRSEVENDRKLREEIYINKEKKEAFRVNSRGSRPTIAKDIPGRHTVRAPGAIFDEAEIHDAPDVQDAMITEGSFDKEK